MTTRREGAVLLHLYLAPRGKKAPVPSREGLENAIRFLSEEGIIGPMLGPGEYASGNMASLLFHGDVEQHLLPAERTFESLHVHIENAERFLPRELPAEHFAEAFCSVCDEPIDEQSMNDMLNRLAIFPVNRVQYDCPCCCSSSPFKEIKFAQQTAIARFWLRIEGASFSRLKASVLERLEHVLGLSLQVVPESIPESLQDWEPMRRWGR